MPLAKRGAASSRAVTNCDDSEASRVTLPPISQPRPETVSGSPPVGEVIEVPRERRPSTTGFSGRSRARGSPSKWTSPSASAASGSRKRITVPALPTSIVAGPVSGPGVMTQVSPWSSMVTPRARSPATISSVSRLRSGPRRIVGDDAMAASTSARFVTDLDPGTFTVARTGPAAVGAGHGKVMPGA